MPTDEPQDNQAYCKAYYQRVKSDPAKYAKRIAAISEARRKRKALGVSPMPEPVKHTPEPVKQPATSRPVLAEGDIRRLAQERAAIMEFDGGLTRPSAESSVAQSLVEEFGEKVLSISDLFLALKEDQ